MEVLALIESVQKQVGRKFSPEEIETGILKDLITDMDYDIIRVVRNFNALSSHSSVQLVRPQFYPHSNALTSHSYYRKMN